MEGITATHPAQENDNAPMFTCNTCGLRFPTADLQRVHMKTDWHRYNLKRRVANLPAISSELFAEKMIQQQHIQHLAEERTGRGSSARSSGNRQVTKKDKKREEKLKKIADRGRSMSYMNEPSRTHGRDESVGSSTFSLGEPEGSAYAPSVTTEGDDLDDFDEYNEEENDGEGKRFEEDSEGGFSELETQLNSKASSVAAQENSSRDVSSSTAAGSRNSNGYESDELEQEMKKRIDRAVKIPPNVCLVDGKLFDSVEENVQYMMQAYGLFIPEKEYLIDLEGLITYFGEKIGLGNMCLYCNFQGKSVHSVRSHMIDKSHIKIPYDSLDDKLEISEFYDFTSSYESSKKPQHKEGVSASVKESNQDEEWEDVSDSEDFEDEDVEQQLMETDGYELNIAPGLRAGHRSLQIYYRQNFRPNVAPTEGQGTILAADRRAATGNGSLVVRDPIQHKSQKRAWKLENKRQNIDYRRNKFINNQPHFRDELLQ